MSRTVWSIKDVPELKGYITVAALADEFGVSKGTIYHLLWAAGAFKRETVVKASRGLDDSRPLILIEENEARGVMGRRAARHPSAQSSDHAKALREWNRRVKAWGRETGWDKMVIQTEGQPSKILVEDYLIANPDDPRPA